MTAQSNFEKVREFHFGARLNVDQWPPTEKEMSLRSELITEECIELQDELYPIDSIPTDRGYVEIELPPNKEKVAKELADILYVVYGTAVSFGIDIDEVFDAVHKSNLTKLIEPEWREDGKLLKGKHYQPPNLEGLV